MVSARFVLALAGLAAAVLPLPAGAQEASGNPPVFATVLRVRGDVDALDVGGRPVGKLEAGATVVVGHTVRAGRNGEALLKAADASMIAVRPGAEFYAEGMSARGQLDDRLSLRIVRGGLRILTGWVGKLNREAVVIYTPSATVGIRGTDHEPYVLNEELAADLAQPTGTYNKVNRGGTTLQGQGGALAIEPGQVGFASAQRSRALFTLALPVLLNRVPDFFTAGAFDAEMDALSPRAEDDAMRQLEELRRRSGQTAAAVAAAAPASSPSAGAAGGTRPTGTAGGTDAAAASPPATPALPGRCGAQVVAPQWLAQLDGAIARHDEAAVLKLFDTRFKLRLLARKQDGSQSTITLGAKEFTSSAVAALRGLTDFSQRRVGTTGQGSRDCRQITVTSVSIEQGQLNGQPYRVESKERYVLERRSGAWVAVEAQAEQQ